MNNLFLNKISEELKKDVVSYELVYLYLNYSVVAGEFLLSNDFSKVLAKIEVDYFQSAEKQFINDLAVYKELLRNINFNICSVLEKDEENKIGKTLNLYNQINEIIYSKDVLSGEEITTVKWLHTLFIINVRIAELDEYLESDDWCLNELQTIEDYLSSEKSKEVYNDKYTIRIHKILLDKCKYLIFKIRYRRDKKRKLFLHKVKIIRDNLSEEIELLRGDVEINSNSKLYIDKNNYYFSFFRKTIEHYQRKDNDEISKKAKDIGSKFDVNNLSSYSISDFYEYNKFLKNETKLSYTEKDSIINKLLLYIESIETKENFSLLAKVSAINFFNNARIRIYLNSVCDNKEDSKYTSILNENFYKQNESESLIGFKDSVLDLIKKDIKFIDFKRFEIVIDFLDDFLEYIISNSIKIFPLEIDNEKISSNLLDQYYENAKNNLKILKNFYASVLDEFDSENEANDDQGLMPIYLEKEACINKIQIKIPGKEIDSQEEVDLNLFLDSSYILPVNFEEIDEKIKKERLVYKYDIKLIRGNIEALYNLKKSIFSYKEIENKFKENEFKIVQIVAMFVTIATFILINVKIFDNKTGKESIAIIFALAGVFVLFNAFFNWLVQGQISKEKKTQLDYFLIGTPIVLIVVSVIILFNCDLNKFSKKEEKVIENKIDSIANDKLKEAKEKRERDSIEISYLKRK